MKYKNIKIHKRKNCNTWYTRFRKNNKVICISAKTQKECYELLKQRYNDNEAVNYNNIKLSEWYTKWLDIYKVNKIRQTTLQSIKYLAKNYFKGNIFDKQIKDIKPIEIEIYLTNIRYTRMKQFAYVYLKDMFNRAKQNNIISINPIDSIEKPKHEKKESKALTIEQQNIFEKYCLLDESKHFYLICLWQGLSISELKGLTKDDINLETKEISINKAIKDNTNDTKTKNKHRNRIIPIFNKTLNILKNYKYDNNKIIDKCKNYIEIHLKEILQYLKIENITMHSLRHTFITRCQEKNIPEYIIQSWVGHAKGSKITTEIYTHKQSDIENKYINIFNNN